MHADFWHDRWKTNQIGFHEGQPNALLVKHYDQLGLQPGARVFLPLCGKTVDISWLLAKGVKVCGVELSSDAIEQLFDELGVTPEKTDLGGLIRFSADNIEIFVGDVFALTSEMLGEVDAIYDRAALVALPQETRIRYARHLPGITESAQQLLIAFKYDQTLMGGPPFSIDDDHVAALYGSDYSLDKLDEVDVPGGLKGRCPATEAAWRLRPLG